MLTIGKLAWRKARAEFSANFFGCAGYDIINNKGFDSVSEGMEAAKKVNADVVVLCSSDDEYIEYGPEFARGANGELIPVVAGYPKDLIDSLKNEGVKHFIHMRSNILGTLKEFHKDLGIEI